MEEGQGQRESAGNFVKPKKSSGCGEKRSDEKGHLSLSKKNPFYANNRRWGTSEVDKGAIERKAAYFVLETLVEERALLKKRSSLDKKFSEKRGKGKA